MKIAHKEFLDTVRNSRTANNENVSKTLSTEFSLDLKQAIEILKEYIAMEKVGYELVMQLKDRGLFQNLDDTEIYIPSLSELLDACGENLKSLTYLGAKMVLGAWCVVGKSQTLSLFAYGSTAEEAVAKFILELKKTSE